MSALIQRPDHYRKFRSWNSDHVVSPRLNRTAEGRYRTDNCYIEDRLHPFSLMIVPVPIDDPGVVTENLNALNTIDYDVRDGDGFKLTHLTPHRTPHRGVAHLHTIRLLPGAVCDRHHKSRLISIPRMEPRAPLSARRLTAPDHAARNQPG